MKKIIVGIIVVFIAFIGFMYIKSSENQGAEVEKVVIEHSLGSVEVPKNPKRVVVFDYGILDILDTFGEVVASTHGNKVTFEYLLEKNPDYIYIVDKAAVVGDNLLANKAFDNPIVKSTKAAQNGNIVFLNSVVWYTASGGLKSTEIMLDEVEKSIEK